VARIGERDRLAAAGDAVAGQHRDAVGRRQGARVEPERARQALVELDQVRRRDRGRRQARMEALGQPRIAVVEGEQVEQVGGGHAA